MGYVKFGDTTSFISTFYFGKENYKTINEVYAKSGRVNFEASNTACYQAVYDFYVAANNVDEYYNKLYINPQTKNTLFEVATYIVALGAMGELPWYGGVGTGLAGGGYSDSLIINVVSLNRKDKLGRVIWFFNNNKDTTIYYAHIPETYYAYIVML